MSASRDVFNLWHVWFGTGWPAADDLTAIHDDLVDLIQKHKAWPHLDQEPTPGPHPATMIGRR